MGTPRPGEWKEKPKGTKEFHLYGFGPSRSQRAAGKSSVRDRISSGALVAAGVLIAAGIAGGIRVVYDAQFRFALAYNWGHEDIAHIQAAIPEVVWVGMALLGLAQALRGRKSARAVSGILLFFSLSMAAQLMYAMPSPGGFLVAAITPIALALLLETFIDGVYRWACARDGIPVEERPILLRIAAALGTVPKLLWVLPAALAVGLLLDFTATWEALRSWLLETAVPLAPWALLAFPGMWLLRLGLDFRGTWDGMRTWLLDMIPYAPGRTRAQDEAREAREAAQRAEGNRAEAQRMADEMVREERRQKEEAIASQKEAHADEVERLRAEFDRQRETDQREAHRQMRALQEEYEGRLSESAERAERLSEQLRASRQQVGELNERVATMWQAVSGRDRLIMAYEALGRQGDDRVGQREHVRDVVRHLLESDPSIGLQSLNTAVNYVVTYLDGDQTSRINGNALAGMS